MTYDEIAGESSDTTNSVKSTLRHHRREKPPRAAQSLWFYASGEHRGGESAVWIAVITQAVLDAISLNSSAEARNAKSGAIRWLTDGGKDFVEVCLLAGYDPDYIRKKAKRIIIAPMRWRAEPGKGKRYLERKAYRECYEKRRRDKLKAKPSSVVIAFAWQQKHTL